MTATNLIHINSLSEQKQQQQKIFPLCIPNLTSLDKWEAEKEPHSQTNLIYLKINLILYL